MPVNFNKMKRTAFSQISHFIVIILIMSCFLASAQIRSNEEAARMILDEALQNGKSYEMLRYLSEEIGGRLSGSPQAAAAVE
jgi:thymidine phosphorylase